MMVQSPLRRTDFQPNLRKVKIPEINERYQQKNGRKADIPEATKISIPKPQPGKVFLVVLALGVFGFFYLNHVFSTQQLLKDVQMLEKEYLKAKSIHDEYKLEYDKLVGPSEIYQKAKELGFIDKGPADQIIRIKE
jgi:cell division protein FtsL